MVSSRVSPFGETVITIVLLKRHLRRQRSTERNHLAATARSCHTPVFELRVAFFQSCMFAGTGAVSIRCPRSSKHKTRQVNCTGPLPKLPLLSVSTFFKLANWYEAHRHTSQGGESCEIGRKESFSAGTEVQPADSIASPLGDTVPRGSSANAAGARSHRGTAASASSKRQGGAS